MYLFDTDALSQVVKSNPSLSFIRKLATIPPHHQFTTTITVGEMVYGAYKSNRPIYFLEKLNNLVLPNIQILPFCEGSAKIYGELRAKLEKEGTPLSDLDMEIASIALYNNLIAVTGNVRHFSKIPDLKVENWL